MKAARSIFKVSFEGNVLVFTRTELGESFADGAEVVTLEHAGHDWAWFFREWEGKLIGGAGPTFFKKEGELYANLAEWEYSVKDNGEDYRELYFIWEDEMTCELNEVTKNMLHEIRYVL